MRISEFSQLFAAYGLVINYRKAGAETWGRILPAPVLHFLTTCPQNFVSGFVMARGSLKTPQTTKKGLDQFAKAKRVCRENRQRAWRATGTTFPHYRTTSHSLLGQMSDWYHITRKALIEKGGRGLFNHHASLEDLLKMVYPGFPWEPTGFIEAGRTPIGHWKDPANLLQALTRAEQRIGILKALIPPPQHLTSSIEISRIPPARSYSPCILFIAGGLVLSGAHRFAGRWATNQFDKDKANRAIAAKVSR